MIDNFSEDLATLQFRCRVYNLKLRVDEISQIFCSIVVSSYLENCLHAKLWNFLSKGFSWKWKERGSLLISRDSRGCESCNFRRISSPIGCTRSLISVTLIRLRDSEADTLATPKRIPGLNERWKQAENFRAPRKSHFADIIVPSGATTCRCAEQQDGWMFGILTNASHCSYFGARIHSPEDVRPSQVKYDGTPSDNI